VNACHLLWFSLAAAGLLAAETTDEKKKWDVNNPPGPKSEVAIKTTRGTWMSLDVSPEGEEIVFDLLGDIYSIPVTGGKARALTTGMAWDMQPRFSPDGKHIAFTSDRGGGDNIWVMKRDGSDPRQVTREDFRLLNSPAWSPDGEFLAARKHFTSARSIGAGEIWLYHRSGGEGLQLTKKPNEQKDAGEPAFSPDGRYVYFSQDTTPGDTFEYNKDPNTQIYVIRRLDRKTGEIEDYVTGPGGSVRPAPSRDGKLLAFVRRVRAKTVLFLRSIESGEEWPIYDGLDRDMQETWAIHGVYPSMAWTPDNGSIVFWAGGEIRRIDIATKQVSTIPLEVETTRQVLNALRFPVKAAPEKFDVKMLRWVGVSPAGDKVAYQALGRIYIRALPDGTPRRLTGQNDHFEFYPSFSRDGQRIVYTTWNDEELGSVRVAPADGGEGCAITRQPGHYLEPVFSPDGTKVVFRKARGGNLVSPHWSDSPGLYWIPAEGGEMTRIVKDGERPHFGAAADRVFFLAQRDKKRVLRSIELDGSDERRHLTSEDALDFRVSPDEKWVAFQELFNAYIAPFVPTGQAVEIGPKTKAIPVAKASRDAGEYLHWSGDSRRLHWSLGPELFSRDLREAFAFLEGAPEKLPEPPAGGLNIGFEVKDDAPAGTLVLAGGRVVTMRGDEVIERGTVVVEGNRIVAVGEASRVKPPAGARVLDVKGMTILPGLVDVHAHGPQGVNEIVPQRNWAHHATLAFGVTTTHDPSNDTSTIFAASEMARAGLIAAPRIFSTGTILYGAKTPFRAEVNSLEEALSHLRRMKAVGAFTVKSYNQPLREQRQQIVEAARQLGMMVVPEGGSLFQHNMSMVADGHTGIEHAIPVAKVYDDVLQFWPKTGTWYTPTLVVGYGGLWGENYWYQKHEVWKNERLLTFVPRFLVDPRARRRTMAPEDEFNHIDIARISKQLVDAGGRVLLGAHGQMQGLAAHWELWMLTQGGMTPMEALRAATLDGARYLGLDGDLGSIEVGKLADLIVVEGNPLQNIYASENVKYTVANGRVYDARTMDQLLPEAKKRGKFFW
jgi:imidazolonepropionase-like amidohydrolase/Tol biopolymer transport system component